MSGKGYVIVIATAGLVAMSASGRLGVGVVTAALTWIAVAIGESTS